MQRPISNDEIGLTNQQRHVGADSSVGLAESASRRA
jgi:hypothetical protein